jgi:predicted AAA+ superfamily ATPase
MIYKDLIERYAIKNTAALKFFIKRILASSTKAISINKLYNELKSNGIKIGKNSLYEYLEYLQNIYLSLVLQRYDTSLVNQELGEKKIYSIDVGLSNAVEFHFSDNIGKSLENMVFLELRRRGATIFYHRDERSECDFVLQENNRITQAILVTYSLQEEETKLREIKGALTACKAYNLSQATIITYDHEDTITQDGIRIEIIPFYKWVLLQY